MHSRIFLCALLVGIAMLAQGVTPSVNPSAVLHVESLEYPRLALFAQIVGNVKVLVDVASDGGVTSATAISGHNLLQRAAEENIKRWRFQVGTQQMLYVTYEFKIEDPTLDDPHTKCVFDLPDKVTVTSNRQAIVGAP